MNLNYNALRNFLNQRMVFTYDTGAKIVGTLVECKPSQGTVQVAVLKDVDIVGRDGKVLEHHDRFSFVPNTQENFWKE